MSGYPWTVHVRDMHLNYVGELDDYQSADLVLKFNDISTWQLTVSRRNRLAHDLTQPGAGIVVSRAGQTILSGCWTKQEHRKTSDNNALVLSGVDDTVWLKRRVAHPQPTSTEPPYSTTAEDVRTNVASNVMRQFVAANISVDGGIPAIIPRQLSTLHRDPDIAYGATVTGRGRWQNLLALLQELAVQGAVDGLPVGFRIAQVGAALHYQNFVPVDRTATVVFSEALGNLREWTYTRTAPDATYWIVGGQGEGTARTIYEYADSAALAGWGRLEGDFVDARAAANTGELAQAAVKANADAAEQSSFAVTPIDTDTQQFGVHYGLGDRVAAVLDVLGPEGGSVPGDVVQDVLRQCRIRLTPDDATVTPAVGTEKTGVGPAIRMFQDVRDLKRRTNNLERR